MWLVIESVGFLVPYALAVAMPSWRWLLTCSVLVGGLLAYWIFGIFKSQFEYGEEGGIVFLTLAAVVVPFVAGVLVRTVSLIMAARGNSRRSVLAVNVLGFALPVGIAAMAFSVW
ncbi:MAG TPA: hypothetical protein VG291_05755 [Xanthobacteraceae bacterium]|jgi:zinc transporter ZupT|nr:hypothetical protein [Xanthobacteraceae bacterium]